MPLEETLSLDIREALRGIDRIEAELTATAQRFKVGLSDALGVLMRPTEVAVDATPVTTAIDQAVQAADTTIEPDDTSAITTGIDEAVAAADGTVPVDSEGADSITSDIDAAVEAADGAVPVEAVDAGGITDEIDAAVQAADTTVEIDADASAATAELDAVSASATTTTESLDETGSALGAVQGASQLAAGDLAGVGATLGAVGARSSVLTGSLLAVASAVGVTVGAALESETALRRFETSLGQFADQLEAVGIPGFADDLTTLAERTGNSDEAMRLAIARVFDLGTSSGVAGEQVAATSEQLALLATRASVLNPTLGDAGAITESLTNALARGGRTLNDFGLSITAAEIESRALRDTGKATADQLTIYERSAAGAAIATEQLGDRLRTDIVRGADQPAIAFRRLREEFGNTLETLGEPLLDDVIEAAEAAQPAMVALAEIFGDIAEIALPPLVQLLEITATTLGVVASGFDKVKEPLSFVERVAGTATNPVRALNFLFGDGGDKAEKAAPKIAKAVKAISEQAGAAKTAVETNQALVTRLDEIAGASSALAVAQSTLGPSSAALFEEFARGAPSIERLGFLSTELGLSQETLVGVFEETTNTVRTFTETAVGGLTSITEAGKVLDEDKSFQQYLDRIRKTAEEQVTFTDNIAKLLARGADDIARTFVEQGLSTAGFAAELTRQGDKKLATQETHLEKTQGLFTRFETAQTDNVQALINKQIELNSVVAGLPPPDFATGLTTALLKRETAFDTASLEFKGRAAASGREIGQDFVAGLALGFESAAETAHRQAEAVVEETRRRARARAKAFSPSRVFAELGRDMVAGLVVGLSELADVRTAADALALAAVPDVRSLTSAIPSNVSVVAVASPVSGVQSGATAGSVVSSSAGSAVTVAEGGALVRYELHFSGDVDRQAVAAGVKDSQPGVVGALEGLLGKIQSR